MGPKFPNLEVISNPPPPQEGLFDTQERRRLPRLSLTGEQFRLSQNGKVFSVSDLSADGMALRILDREDFRLFPIGAWVEGMINIKREKYPLSGKVRRLGKDVVGCQFESLTEKVKEALAKQLDPEVLGRELKLIPASEAHQLWFHGTSGTDLLLWQGEDGQCNRISLYVLGIYVQWDTENGLSTGRTEAATRESAEVRGALRFETMFLDPDPSPDRSKLHIAKTLILSSNLSQELKNRCIGQIEPTS